MASGKGPSYFDDFSIRVKEFDSTRVEVVEFSEVELQINKVNFQKIKDKRDAARKRGLLISSRADLVDADMRLDSMTMACRVRLKGDLMDHLSGERWSYRIELKGDERWNQMKKFSVHYSAARSHLAEWVMHQMMKKEGIISPNTDFLRLKVNTKDMGIFAYEHHFENEMLEENKRLVAPIIKHNDNGFWENIKGDLKKYNWVPSTQMELFNKENDNQKSFADLYQYGHDQLYYFLFKGKAVDEVFDIDRMAKYYALIEIGHGTHAQLLTNIRFYVNPVSGLLEPVGYDFYGSNMPKINEDWRPIGQWENGENIHERSMTGSNYMVRLFADSTFFEKYMQYVVEFTDPDYLKRRFDELKFGIKIRNDYINTDTIYKDYVYDFFGQFKKAKYTRAKLFPLTNVSLKSYRDPSNRNVHLQSFHYFPLKVLGYTSSKGKWMLDKPIIMNGYSPNSSLRTYEMECAHNPKEIIFQTLGVDSIFYHKVSKNIFPRNRLKSGDKYVSLSQSGQFEFSALNYTPTTKNIIIDKAYIIKKEESVTIPSGTVLQFEKGGNIRIEGSINAFGSPTAPILFKGNGGMGSGMVLSKSNNENQFLNCIFKNLSSYKHGNVGLDAAVQIDESNVFFENCVWSDTDAPVDLKLNNSEYELRNCSFANNAGTAVQSYYSVGKIEDLLITNYGKGGIKQVGGNIKGERIQFKDCNGKAIDIDDFALTRINTIAFQNCRESLVVSDHSDVRFDGYKGKASFRDIQVTGDYKPYTKVTIVNAEDSGKLGYILSPKAKLIINHTKKRMK
ncbi:MAG: hypothetical protein AAGA77_01620 [Bacteroidota bacterium]